MLHTHQKARLSTLELEKTSPVRTPEGPGKSGLRTLPGHPGSLPALLPAQKEQSGKDLEHPLGAKKIQWCLECPS